ncbi:maleylpyruvate isomerase N-terminal domain-containing protein [Actinoplanes sp. NPDC020271]|uniref:maleylpyruvate isomerase N-terminal domain-containing protein n=1 Tax=Actinoplanes sp. NPDC020271 TaxID=3363896 RepID=UPI003797CAAC
MDFRRTYRSAAIAYAGLVAAVPSERLDDPGLGEWTLRELLGHTVSSALRQVPVVLATRAPVIEVATPEGYFAYARSAPPDLVAAAHTASTEDARAAADQLGDKPADEVSTLIGRATEALSQVNDDDVITSAAGGMRVRDWIPTRTFELVVHGLDAATAIGVDYDLPVETLAESLTLASRTALGVGAGVPLLMALTGRTPLPPHFSILTPAPH